MSRDPRSKPEANPPFQVERRKQVSTKWLSGVVRRRMVARHGWVLHRPDNRPTRARE